MLRYHVNDIIDRIVTSVQKTNSRGNDVTEDVEREKERERV